MSEPRGHLFWHAVRWIELLLMPIPEMMRHELDEQRFRCRPWQRLGRRGKRPSFKICQIRGQRPHGVGAKSLLGEVLKRRNIVIGQKFRQLFAAVKRQDGIKRIKFLGARERRINFFFARHPPALHLCYGLH